MKPPARWMPNPCPPILNAGRIDANRHHPAIRRIERDQSFPHRARCAPLGADAERIGAVEGDVDAAIGRDGGSQGALARSIHLDGCRSAGRRQLEQTAGRFQIELKPGRRGGGTGQPQREGNRRTERIDIEIGEPARRVVGGRFHRPLIGVATGAFGIGSSVAR